MPTTIDSTWLAANAATYGGPPYVLDVSTTYNLGVDVAVPGAAFVVARDGIIFDLNGHSITWGNLAAFGPPNGGFELGSGTSVTNWSLSGAPTASICNAADHWLIGSQALRFLTPSTAQVITSDAFTLPAAVVGHTVTATVIPSWGDGASGQTLLIEVLAGSRSSPGSVLATGLNTHPIDRGAMSIATWSPVSVAGTFFVRITYDPAGTAHSIDIDAVRVTASYDYAFISTVEYEGGTQDPWYSNFPPAVKTAYDTFHGGITSFTLKNTIPGTGGVFQGAQKAHGGGLLRALYLGTLLTVDHITATLNGDFADGIIAGGQYGGNSAVLTITNNTITFDAGCQMSTHYSVNAACQISQTNHAITFTGNVLTGFPQYGLALSECVAGPIVITGNSFTNNAKVADPHAIVISGSENFEIASNTIVTTNGGGIALDQYSSVNFPLQNGIVHDNTITVGEMPNRESGQGGVMRCIRHRNSGGSQSPYPLIKNVQIYNNTMRTNVVTGGMLTGYVVFFSQWDSDGSNLGQGTHVTNNTMKCIVTPSDPTYTGACLNINGGTPGVLPIFTGNTLESNDISLYFGGANDNSLDDMTVGSNTFTKSSLGDQTRTYHAIGAGQGNVGTMHGVRVFSPIFAGGATMAIKFFGSALKDIETGWLATITVNYADTTPAPSAVVTVHDVANTLVFTGTANSSGQIVVPVVTTTYTQATTNPAVITTTSSNPLAFHAVSADTAFNGTMGASPTANVSYTIALNGTPGSLGTLEIACATGQTTDIHTSMAFGALNGATAWTVAFFYQFAAIPDPATWSDVIQIGGGPWVEIDVRLGNLNVKAWNGALSKAIPLDTVGHHVVIGGSAVGPSTIYVDGIPSVSVTGLGPLPGSDTTAFIQWWDTSGYAGTYHLKDLAIWGGYCAHPQDAIDLADGAHTPANLGTPATNYWTLQGSPGAVSFPPGLTASLGGVDFGVTSGTGVLTYDAHAITVVPVASVFFMTPYVDTTGYLLYIPLYFNPAISGGGPVLPSSVRTDPVFTVGGSGVVPARLPLDSLCAMVAYQFASPVPAGAIVTMAASIGWALTTSGAVGGTSAAGLGSDPVTCLNYAGTSRDYPPVTPTFRCAQNVTKTGNRGSSGQVMQNWARRMISYDPGNPAYYPWSGNATVTSVDANNLPASFAGSPEQVVWGYIEAPAANNGADYRGYPGLMGMITLIYGDATAGVGPSTHVLDLSLVTVSPGWTVGTPNVVNEGEWDAAYPGGGAWHKITRVYPITWSEEGGFLGSQLLIQFGRLDGSVGPIKIPILANGMSELGVFEPNPDDRNVPVTLDYDALFDPLAVSPVWLQRFAGTYSIRWMSNQLAMTTSGSGDLVYPADLDMRKASDFLASNQVTSGVEIASVNPVPGPTVNVVLDYLNGDMTGTVPMSMTTWDSVFQQRAVYLVTTRTPHGMHTGKRFFIGGTPPAYRALAINSTYLTITANINAVQTVIPFNQVLAINGGDNSQVDDGTIFQLGSGPTAEQIQVHYPLAGLNVTVTRGYMGTTAQSYPAGTVLYPCFVMAYGNGANEALYIVSATQVLSFAYHRSIPRNAPAPPTLLQSYVYPTGNCPGGSKKIPLDQGTSTYELCSRATRLVADANPDGKCICWVSIPFFATDALITEVVNRMIPDFVACPGMDLIVQCDNEVFNAGFYQWGFATQLMPVAPNPETGGIGFLTWSQYWASRQHHFNLVARAAFTAALLNPDRVVWYHNATSVGQIDQHVMRTILAYCQTHQLPLRSISTNSYADLGTSLCGIYVSWLPGPGSTEPTGVPGAAATWDLATARKVMMSYYRSAMRHGITLGATYPSQTLSISRYNNGISVDGSSPPNTNPVRGRLCVYEGATTATFPQPFPLVEPPEYLPGGTPGAGDRAGTFPNVGAWVLAMQYDPEWYETERCYYEVQEDMAYQHALLMGANYPDPEDARMEFGCYFGVLAQSYPIDYNFAYTFAMHRWQWQKAGYGDGRGGSTVNRLDFWGPTPSSAVSREMTANGVGFPPTINESVRGQVQLDWIAGTVSSPTPTPTPTPTHHGVAHDTATFHDLASIAGSTPYLGRYRRGDWVMLMYTLPSTPDAAPIAVVQDQANVLVEAFPLATRDRGRLVFEGTIFVDQDYHPGLYSAYAYYTIDNMSATQLVTFDVIAGGDSGGAAIAVFGIDRPEAQSVVAQLASGRLVVGANPSVPG